MVDYPPTNKLVFMGGSKPTHITGGSKACRLKIVDRYDIFIIHELFLFLDPKHIATIVR